MTAPLPRASTRASLDADVAAFLASGRTITRVRTSRARPRALRITRNPSGVSRFAR